jgi:hypothetical protein
VEPDKTPRKRASKFIKDLVVPAWQPSRDRVLWATRIVLVLVVLLAILTLIGLPFGITLWAWVKLLIVPAVLAIGGYLFNSAQSRATQAAAERRAQDEALQAYLDQMSDMLIPNTDRPSLYKAQPSDDLSIVARARTLTVLARLDGKRKGRVVQFLYETGLISKRRPVFYLRGADLRKADLTFAELMWEDPTVADRMRADLLLVDLRGDSPGVASLERVDLRATDLSGTNLSGADLSGADLRCAHLSFADLVGANLSGADLTRAQIHEMGQLRDLFSLEGATMPNGQRYEDWLKSKDREDG